MGILERLTMNNEQIKKLAIECGAYEYKFSDNSLVIKVDQLTAFATALLASEQEPVAEFKIFQATKLGAGYCQFVFDSDFVKNCKEGDKVYAHPPQSDCDRYRKALEEIVNTELFQNMYARFHDKAKKIASEALKGE